MRIYPSIKRGHVWLLESNGKRMTAREARLACNEGGFIFPQEGDPQARFIEATLSRPVQDLDVLDMGHMLDRLNFLAVPSGRDPATQLVAVRMPDSTWTVFKESRDKEPESVRFDISANGPLHAINVALSNLPYDGES